MNIEDIKSMSDQEIIRLKGLLDLEAADRMIQKKAEYIDRFKELFDDAKRDGIALGVSLSNGERLIAHSPSHLYVGKW